MNLDFWVLVLPVVQENGPDGPVDPARVEDEDGALGQGRAAQQASGCSGRETDFGDGDIS